MNLDDDTKLDHLLRDREAGYIDDAGFTARVMTKLPSGGPASRRRRRTLLVGGAAVLSAACVALPAAPALGALGHWLWNQLGQAITIEGISVPLAVLLACAVGCVIAVWSAREAFRD